GGRASENSRPVAARLAPAMPALARRADPWALRDVGVAEPVALEPDVQPLVLAPQTRCGEGVEIDRQVLLEVVVERAPAVSDPAGQPRPRGRLAADDDR